VPPGVPAGAFRNRPVAKNPAVKIERGRSYEKNSVVLTVEANHGKHGVQSQTYYNSFSLLKTMEAAFGLPCLNHACDPGVNVMSDLFSRGDED